MCTPGRPTPVREHASLVWPQGREPRSRPVRHSLATPGESSDACPACGIPETDHPHSPDQTSAAKCERARGTPIFLRSVQPTISGRTFDIPKLPIWEPCKAARLPPVGSATVCRSMLNRKMRIVHHGASSAGKLSGACCARSDARRSSQSAIAARISSMY